jgi:peptidyl-prolyl cis-trans isomerase C
MSAMSGMTAPVAETPPTYAYHLLKVALNSFQKNPSQLDGAELQQARQRADKSFDLENLVLSTPEAGEVVVNDTELDRALGEVAGRYEKAEEFQTDLQRNGLDEADLREALRRELIFDGVMQKVGAQHPKVDDLDVRLFYEIHRERFAIPEKRTARHILITINPDFPENTRPAALARAEGLAEKLVGKSNRFASLARQHSECPTALEGGKLGTVQRGQLYPELDAWLFSLGEGEISEVVESEVGFHILWCEKVVPEKFTPLSKARPRIEQILEERKRRNCQKNWLAELRRARDGDKELS